MKQLYSLLLLVLPFCISAQNLVLNPGFEDYVNCPAQISNVGDVANVYQATSGTVDYYNACATNPDADVPNNMCGYQQANTGNAYMGFFNYSYFSDGIAESRYYEYLGMKLSEPLLVNKRYCVSFYVSLTNSNVGAGGLGALFTVDSTTFGGIGRITQTPQILFDTIVLDTTGWALLSANFTTDSAYNYLIIGGFQDPLGYNWYPLDTATFDTSFIVSMSAYYFIDDVTVEICQPLNIDEEESRYNVYPNPAGNSINIILPENSYNTRFALYNSLGRVVKNEPVAQTQNIDISSLPNGLYYYTITQDNTIITQQKLLISR